MRKNFTLFNQHLETLLIQDGQFQAEDFEKFHDQLSQNATSSLDRLLIDEQHLSRDKVGQLLSKSSGLKYQPLGQTTVKPSVFNTLPREFIELKQVIPIDQQNGKLQVAMVNGHDQKTLDEITYIAGIRPDPVVITAMEYEDFLAHYQAMLPSTSNGLFNDSSNGSGFSEAALNDWITSLFEQALQQQSSDIHIEPRREGLSIRFRADGILKHQGYVPDDFQSAFIPRLKVMANMDITEYRRPQEGRIKLTIQSDVHYFRMSSIPLSDNQEKLTLRILKPFKGLMEFSTLGMDDDSIATLQELCQSPSGIILTCGPTGVGKSTTLYTIINSLNTDARNIMTIEDPIELKLPNINQSQVNLKSQYTFAHSIASILRQDPDVIMIGEIRDNETLDATIQAALTGHLILSSLHSNSAAGTLTRLIEMGASPKLLSSTLSGIVAQRLIRTLCPHCKEAYTASEREKTILFPFDPARQTEKITLYRSTGCQLCDQSGYSGRIGLFEIMRIDRELRYVISEFSSDLQLEDAAISSGMKTLSMNGRMKALSGATSLDEIIRVLGIHQEST